MSPSRAATRLYRLALAAFPRGHRTEYASEMADAFDRERASQVRTHGRWRACRFVIAACVDAIGAGISERRRLRRADRGGQPVIASLGRDLVHAVRALAKARGFTLVTVASLGIGLGTVFAFVGLLRVLIGAPPGITGDGLVELVVIPNGELRARVNDWAIDTWSYPDFVDVRDGAAGLSVAGWATGQSILRLPAGAGGLRVDTMYASANYFTVVGVPLARGRGFDAAETGEPVVIVGHRFWQTRLGGNPGIIGSTLVVEGRPHVVVGVAAEGYRGHFSSHRPGFQIWLPLAAHPQLSGPRSLRFDREADWLRVLGRLSAGTSLAQADGAVRSIMAGIAERHPASHRLKSGSVQPYFAMSVRQRFDARLQAVTLLAAAGMVLLIVCLNLSGMVLVRSATRERELAVRLAIGASRARLVQYLLSEALVIAALGGLLAAAVVFGTPAALASWFGASDELPVADATVVATCAGLCFAASLLFGLLPALRFSRPAVMRALKDDAGGGRRVGRVHRLTVAIQAGLAVPFLVMSGVQLDQVRRSANAPLGFDPPGLFAAPIDLTAAAREGQDVAAVVEGLATDLARASGVSSVSAANGLPLDQHYRKTPVTRDGVPAPVRAHTTRVSPAYLETMGIPLLRGRGITAGDRLGSELVVVISESLARRLFPDGDALGARITFALEGSHGSADIRWSNLSTPSSAHAFTVIGISADLVDDYMGPPGPQLFVSLAQHPVPRVYVIARSSAGIQATTTAFERAVAAFYPEPDVIRSSVVSGEDLVRRGRGELMFGSTLSAAGACAGLMLAALGIFGVVGFMVATRTREIGIRIALGATRSRVLGSVLVDAVKVAAPGVVVGLLLAFVAANEIAWASQQGVRPLVYTAAVAVALGVAVVAGLPAARKAAAVEPIVAMRAE